MARPRKTNHNLPSHVYMKGKQYYYVRNNKWIRIGETLDGVDLTKYAAQVICDDDYYLKRHLLTMMSVARTNSAIRGREFRLVKEDVLGLLKKSGLRCMVTGVPFSLDRHGKNGKRPFAPSIDRIDCTKGYTTDNVRLVCQAANIAMHTWGEEVLHIMASNMRSNYSGFRRLSQIHGITRARLECNLS